jgi:ABC-type lipoprotein export system ATPase subunit
LIKPEALAKERSEPTIASTGVLLASAQRSSMQDEADSLVVLREIIKVYGTSSAPVPVLNGISVTIKRGEKIGLLGKSGSGKSTLLNLLGGLDVPSSGSICVNGRDLATMSANDRAVYRLQTVGMIFQAFHLISTRTALENVELPMIFAGVSRKERQRLALAALEAVGLSHRLTHRPNELSGGERQRVAIARSLVNKPDIILADEPTGNLDSTTGKDIIELLMKHVEINRSTLVLVTHDEELAGRCADRIVRVQDGRLVS